MSQNRSEVSLAQAKESNNSEKFLDTLRSKSVLTTEEYLFLLELATNDDAVRSMILAKLEGPINNSPLVAYTLALDAEARNHGRKSKDTKREKSAKKGGILETKYESLIELRDKLFPNFEIILQNWHNFLVAVLITPDLLKRQLYLSIVLAHFGEQLSIYQILETLLFIQEQQDQSVEMQLRQDETSNSTLTNERDWEVNTSRSIADLMSAILGLIGTLNITNGAQIVKSMSANSHRHSSVMKRVFDNNSELLSPINTRTNLIVSEDGGVKEAMGVIFPGFISAATSQVKDYWIDNSDSNSSPYDAFRHRHPNEPDWLGDWNTLPFNRIGLPVCIAGLNVHPLSNKMRIIVFPVKNSFPVVIFMRKGKEAETHHPESQEALVTKLMVSVRRQLADYCNKPSLDDAEYFSGGEIIDVLLEVFPDRYHLNIPVQALALAKIAGMILTRGGWQFEFGLTNPEEKKIYELGIRTLLLKKPKSDSDPHILAEAEVVIAGNVKLSFNLFDDGSAHDFKQNFGNQLSVSSIEWLRKLAIGYLGQLELIKIKLREVAISGGDASNHERGEDSFSLATRSRSPVRGFRVMLNNLPNLGGQWLDLDSRVNNQMEYKLGTDLPTLNDIFIKLQAAFPVRIQFAEAALDEQVALIIASQSQVKPGDRDTLATLLKLLWYRANKILTISASEGNKKIVAPSKRLEAAIKSGLLGNSGIQITETSNQVFTVTFVEGIEGSTKIAYHLPEIAELFLGEKRN